MHANTFSCRRTDQMIHSFVAARSPHTRPSSITAAAARAADLMLASRSPVFTVVHVRTRTCSLMTLQAAQALVDRGSEEYYTYQVVVNRLHASGLRRYLVDKQNQETIHVCCKVCTRPFWSGEFNATCSLLCAIPSQSLVRMTTNNM
jgi:hypothetical protein